MPLICILIVTLTVVNRQTIVQLVKETVTVIQNAVVIWYVELITVSMIAMIMVGLIIQGLTFLTVAWKRHHRSHHRVHH